jgi:soluble lytic murein transglycosylase-like protein
MASLRVPVPISQHQLPIAAAALLGGAMLAGAPGDALAPDAAARAFATCLPVHIEAPAAALSASELQLARYLSRRYMVGQDATERVVYAAYQAAEQVGLDPLLLLAVAAVESSFNPLAESVMGAKGLMQIIPRYHRDKLRVAGGDQALFDPEANILVGARILQEYVQRTGTLEAGLQFYNGAFFDATAQYARKVMAERARLEAALRGVRELREAALPAVAS